MRCGACGNDTPASGGRCASCGASLAGGRTAVDALTPGADEHTQAPTFDSAETAAVYEDTTGLPTSAAGARHRPLKRGGPLRVGEAFGERYHIIRLLGEGGMGAVYHAWDAELGVAVALKVIRADTVSPNLETRFKNELLLARQVTHKHVVRIHDLGTVNGVKYISMPYVEGRDLASLLRREGKLPVARALALARQIAEGLAAAHDAGVVHRDLKPANIMISGEDDNLDAQIMDFGISASSADASTAGMIGTPEYMAPEQAEGRAVDARADVYAFGLILFEMLTGLRSQPMATERITALRDRIHSGVPRVKTLDASIAAPLDEVIARCLAGDADTRYANGGELSAALARLDDRGELVPEPRRLTRRQMIAAAVAVAAMIGGTYYVARPGRQVRHEPVSALVADFENKTGDPEFQGTLEQALGIGLEDASFITLFPRNTAQALATRISPGSKLDESVSRLVSGREGIKVILAGSIQPARSGYSLSVRAVDPANGRTLATASATSANKADVLKAVGAVASRIRRDLGDTTPESAKRAAMETFTAASLDAAHDFSQGQDLAAVSRHEDAIAAYKRALQKDPKFGRAYAAWAVSAATLGRREEAADAYKQAFTLLDRMTEREKYRTLGAYFLTTARNYEEAVKNYSKLVELYPADRAGHSNLAITYFYLLNFPKALDEGRRAVDIYPQDQRHRTNYALYAMYAGDFDTASREARRVIEQDAGVAKAYLPLAMAALAKGDVDAARDAYDRMAKTGPFGASLARTGLSDLAIYQSRMGDAETLLTTGAATDEAAKNTAGLAAKLLALAEVYVDTGRRDRALQSVRRAVALGRDETISMPAARVYLRAGNVAEARALADALGQQLQPERRAYARLLAGEIALTEKRPVDAVEAFQAAQKIADVWLGRVDLGIAFIEAQHYAEALPELELAQKRRGEATAIFLDDMPTFRYVVPLPYWLARAQEGLGVPAAWDNYRAFLALRPAATKDPLAADAQQRLGAAPR